MKNNRAKTLVLGCTLLAAIYFMYTICYPQLVGPNRTGQQLQMLAERDEDKSAIHVGNAEIIEEKDNSLKIRYSVEGGTSNTEITACGGVEYGSDGYAWGCQPRAVPRDAKTIEITYLLASTAKNIECSDSVHIDFYIGRGSVFYTKKFALEKIWHKNPSMRSWFTYRQQGCN